jgi:hypothetical protein
MKEFPNGSTKASSYLMPGFLSQKFMVQDDKNKKKSMNNKTIKKRNLYDIERTLDINIEILRNYFKTTTSTMTLLNQDKEIIEKFEKIININKRKKELLQEIKEKKSKNLIQLQINLENKRKLEETVEKYKDSLFDNEDAVNNKDEYVKLFQKKFVEVEIYLKRITSDMSDLKKKKYYQNYKMDNFLLLNVNLNRKKQKIIDDISKYDNDKNNLKKENQKIKKEENLEHIKDEQNEIQIKNEEKNLKKTNELLEKKYEKNIEEKLSKIEKLKKFLDKKINIDNLVNNNEIKKNVLMNNYINNNIDNKKGMFKKVEVKKINKERKEIKKEKERDKSKMHNDMTKRMNSFMDLSIVLNENSNINNNNNNIKISRMWGDVSAIAKKEDDI